MLPLFWPLLLIALPVALLGALFKLPAVKGWTGEAWMRLLMQWRLPAADYQRVDDVTLPSMDGSTQIDHILLSRYGVFVIETKNMAGWIFGDEHQAQWTQQLYRRRYRFQNPLRQNYRHLKAVQQALALEENQLHSVVNFIGSSTFKTPMPAHVTQGGGFLTYIQGFKTAVFTPEDVAVLRTRLQQARLAPGHTTRQQHLAHLQQRHDPQAQRQCPRCGQALVLRTASKGTQRGKRFWGCSAYPRCRTRQDL